MILIYGAKTAFAILASDVTEYLKSQRGAGVMLLLPKTFNPKNRNDFPKMSKDFETLWVEFSLPYKKFPSLLVNVAYNPEKSKTDIFLEELALQIDYEKAKNLITWRFQYKLPSPQRKKQNGHNSCTYGLSVVNKTPTRGKNLVDFVIKDDELPHSNVFTFESPITSDHKAIAIITNVTKNKKKPPRRKTIFDESKYFKTSYLQDLKQIDWDVPLRHLTLKAFIVSLRKF